MSIRALFVAASVLALAACGPQSSEPTAEVPPATTAPAVAVEATPEEIAAKVAALEAPYNAGDYEKGRKLFVQCRSCHLLEADAGNRVGPNLHGVFGRKAGALEGFTYSPALQSAGFTWDGGKLDEWLANPRTFLPGNRMSFAGIKDDTARRDLITYLHVETAK